jgi:glucose-1-phosphate thymidylyltransferase
MKCLLLCGGFATRLYPLTIYKAKPLLEHKGKPLLTHIVDKIPQGMDILVTCNRKFEADFCQWQKNLNRQLELCVEDAWTEKQRKGAVSSLDFWISSKNIAEDLLVIAGDNYFEFDLSRFIASHNGKNALVAVYDIVDKSKASQFGVVQLDGGSEGKRDNLGSLIAYLVDRDEVCAYTFTELWFDVGSQIETA